MGVQAAEGALTKYRLVVKSTPAMDPRHPVKEARPSVSLQRVLPESNKDWRSGSGASGPSATFGGSVDARYSVVPAHYLP